MSKFLLGGAVAMIAATVAVAQVPAPAGKPGLRTRAMQTETRSDVAANVGKMFATLDTNKDGFVTQAEADAVKAQRLAKRQERAERRDPAKMFDRLDANKDGQITRAEADAARAARAAKGRQAGASVKDGVPPVFDRADANRDGKITRAEFAAVPKPRRGGLPNPGDRHPPAARLLTTADANKDGRVSLAEMQQLSLQRFDAGDLNHDGKITLQERKQLREQRRGQRKPG